MSEDIEKLGSVDDFSSPPAAVRLPSGIGNIGLYHQAAGCHPNPIPTREGLEVVEVMTGGRGWVEHEGEWIEVRQGAMLWHMPGEKTIGRSDWEDPYRCVAVRFTVAEGVRRRVAPRFTAWNDVEEVERFAREVIRWRLDGAFDEEALVQYTHGRLLFQAKLWERQQAVEALPPPQLREALEWMKGHFSEPLPLKKVARRVGWSPSHLHEMFRVHLGTTPHRFLMERRIRYAKERLAMTNDSVKEVAAATGFSSAAAFCHAFRQHAGTTPLSYRDALRS